MAAVQWHPEFHDTQHGTFDDAMLLNDFSPPRAPCAKTPDPEPTMPTLKIHNPATGVLLAEPNADDAASVATKAVAARAALPAWGRVPLAEKLAMVQRFRAGVVAELDALAHTLTLEMGKPVTEARNELNGLLPRIDFFLEQTEASISDEHVFDGGGMHEQITHVPLGVVANISAWNYPCFVGCNVFVPALLTGNVVVYKPSELAALTGLQIAACCRRRAYHRRHPASSAPAGWAGR